MNLQILGSSSSGNCYLFESKNDVLIVEAGIRLSEVKKALNFDLSKVVGCLITHEHGDHAKYAKDIISSGIDVFASAGTIEATKLNSHRLYPIKHAGGYQIGGFKILPFDVKHDAKQPLGFIIYHPEMGNVLFLTDSYFVEYQFPGLNQLLVECNYSEEILKSRLNSGSVHPSIANRVRTSHMSLRTTKELLQANDLRKVNNIVLIHLSDKNSDAGLFQSDIHELTGKTVTIADKGVTLDFNLKPF